MKKDKKEPKEPPKARTRNYATVVYPESAPENWRDALSDFMVPCFISPLHDKDMNPQNEPKKEHYHVLLMFDSVKTADQAREVFDAIGGVGCERVQSLRGYARYLCHLDNPEKAQYKTDKVVALCGADYVGTINLVTDKYIAIKEMMEFCEDNGIVNFAQLMKIARETNDGWFRVLCDSGTIVMKEHLKSLAWGYRAK